MALKAGRRFAAFLRAVNVGGRTVRMDHLRRLFESLGFSAVETFIASGNVVFETTTTSGRGLERTIERALADGLGYDVATFVRTERELAAIADRDPFPPAERQQAVALNVALLADELDRTARADVATLATEIDLFRVDGREIYWLCRKKQSESRFSNAILERTLGRQATLRGMRTIERMAAKYCRDSR